MKQFALLFSLLALLNCSACSTASDETGEAGGADASAAHSGSQESATADEASDPNTETARLVEQVEEDDEEEELGGEAYGQDEIGESMALKAHIPDGYEILHEAKGDLNRDTYTDDVVLVLRKPDEESTSDVVDNPEARPVLMLLSDGNGQYRLHSRHDNLVMCVDCGGMMGDPFVGVTIKNGYVSFEHYGGASWRWVRIPTFKWDQPNYTWVLHRDGRESFHSGDPENVTNESLTKEDFGTVLMDDFDIYGE